MSSDADNMELDGEIADILYKQEKRQEKYKDREVNREYPALTTFAGIYRIVAWIGAVVYAFLTVVAVLSMFKDFWTGFELTLKTALIGAVVFITIMAISEGIKVFIRIERNTSRTVELLENMTAKK